MEFRILASGSRGNSYLLITNSNKRILVECGIRFKELQKSLHFTLHKIEGCLISHSHKDHSLCAKELLHRGINIYTSKGTADALNLSGYNLHIIRAKQQFKLANLMILPFDTIHDDPEPLGFLIFEKETRHKLLFATDTAYIPYKFNNLTHIAIEYNHDREYLKENMENGNINPELVKRIMQNHMSKQSVERFLSYYDTDHIQVYYLHQSENNL